MPPDNPIISSKKIQFSENNDDGGIIILFPKDDYDQIIMERMLKVAMNFFNSKPKSLSISPFVFGVNEIAHLVENEMSYITALKHINKLIEEDYLIDLNDIIQDILDPIVLEQGLEDNIESFLALEILSPILEKLVKKLEKAKKRLIINYEKLGLREWFLDKIE